MTALVGILIAPRRTLASVVADERIGPAATAVVLSALVCLELDIGAAFLEPASSRGTTFAVSGAATVLLVGFWLLSAAVIDKTARAMGAPSRRRRFLAASGHSFVVLIVYAAIGLLQAAALHGLGDNGELVAMLAGYVALGVLGWFVALNCGAIAAVYELPFISAFALALLPFALLSAAVMVLVVVISGLSAAGAV